MKITILDTDSYCYGCSGRAVAGTPAIRLEHTQFTGTVICLTCTDDIAKAAWIYRLQVTTEHPTAELRQAAAARSGPEQYPQAPYATQVGTAQLNITPTNPPDLISLVPASTDPGKASRQAEATHQAVPTTTPSGCIPDCPGCAEIAQENALAEAAEAAAEAAATARALGATQAIAGRRAAADELAADAEQGGQE